MFSNVADLKTKHGNKHVAAISIRRKIYKISLWRQFYHSSATKNHTYLQVFVFSIIQRLKISKIHCLKIFRFACAVLLRCRAFVERSSVRQTVNLEIFKPWRVEKMNIFQTCIFQFNFEHSLIFEKSVP